MATAPSIEVTRIDYGPYPQAARLNPRLSTESPLLLATLDIGWKPENPRRAVAGLESSMIKFSPRFRKHECRGAAAYHVFRGEGDGSPRGPIEGSLALAHLIEHAVIDFQCEITGDRRCSGVTAALRGHEARFDLMVECRDPRVGKCSLALALAWLGSALDGRPPGPAEREMLQAARLAWRRAGQSLTPALVARALGWSLERSERALAGLRQVGYLREDVYALNLSGMPGYRLADNGHSTQR